MRVLVCTNMWPSAAQPTFGSFVKEQVKDLDRAGLELDVLYVRGTLAGESRTNYARAAVHLRDRLASRSYDLVHAHYGLTGAVALTQGRSRRRDHVPRQRDRLRPVADPRVVVCCSHERADLRQLGRARADEAAARARDPRRRRRRPLPAARPPAVRRELGWQPEAQHVLLPGSRGNRRKGATLFDAVLEQVRQRTPDVQAVTLDNLSREGAARVVAASDVVLMTSEFEGAPAAIKEALACATPVVSVPVGDVPDTISGLPGCFVRGREVPSLADAVLRALDAPGAPALRARAEEFARPLIAERVRQVYEQVLGGNKRATVSETVGFDRNGGVTRVVDHVGQDPL